MKKEKISICLLFPDLLGTYGDGGNATVLAKRLDWRGIDHELIAVTTGQTIPTSCDIYLLGGGEDQTQAVATDQLLSNDALGKAVKRGAVVFAVCAGMQIIGERFDTGGGTKTGLGLLDIVSFRDDATRRVGELAVRDGAATTGASMFTGYENHGSATTLGDTAQPLGLVTKGRGNDDGKGFDGALQDHVVGTYMHGPALARNPELADRLLSWAAGRPLAPIDDQEVDDLRAERLAAGDDATRPAREVLKLLGGAVRSRLKR